MPTLLFFPLADLATPQTVTVTPVTDADFEPATASIDLMSSKVNDPAHVAVSVVEPGILLLGTVSGLACPNDPLMTTVRLRGNPGGAVTVAIAPAPVPSASAAPLMLSFDSTNFATTQNVAVNSTTGPGTATFDFRVPAEPLITTVRYTLSVRSPGTPICNI
jgi:hypothetical protein